MTTRRLLCLACGEESTVSDDVHQHGCPKCGDTTGAPADLGQSLDLHISTHELRIITMWAMNYAELMDRQHPDTGVSLVSVMQVILNRIATQTNVALTLSQDIADLRAAFPNSDVTVTRDDGTPLDI
jgi:hypothetical protein